MASEDTASLKRTVYLDLSLTANSPLATGIQRVVRNIALELPKVQQLAETKVVEVVYRDRAFQPLDLQKAVIQFDYRKFRQDVSSQIPVPCRRLLESLCRRCIPARRWLLPAKGRMGIYYLPAKLASLAMTPIRYWTRPQREIKIKPNDVLLLPDGYWAKQEVWHGVELAKSSGAKIAVIVYDVLPLTHSQFFPPESREAFADYLDKVFQTADVIIAISNATKIAIEELLSSTPKTPEDSPETTTIRMGANLPKRDGAVRQEVIEFFETLHPTILVVATLEPRKNHHLVIDAIEKLWRKRKAKLLFAGRLGWMSEELVERLTDLQSDSELFSWFSELTDSEVSYCYEKSSIVLCPSLAEGYGLPIIEGRLYGKRILASDTQVHREVGGRGCHFYNANEAQDLSEKLDLLLSSECNSNEATQPVPRWSDCALDLATEIERL